MGEIPFTHGVSTDRRQVPSYPCHPWFPFPLLGLTRSCVRGMQMHCAKHRWSVTSGHASEGGLRARLAVGNRARRSRFTEASRGDHAEKHRGDRRRASGIALRGSCSASRCISHSLRRAAIRRTEASHRGQKRAEPHEQRGTGDFCKRIFRRRNAGEFLARLHCGV